MLYSNYLKSIADIVKRCTYKDDKLDGLYESFCEDGRSYMKFTYENGQLITKI